MDVSEKFGTPKSSILIGFSIINHPFLGYPYFWKHSYFTTFKVNNQQKEIKRIQQESPPLLKFFLHLSTVLQVFIPSNPTPISPKCLPSAACEAYGFQINESSCTSFRSHDTTLRLDTAWGTVEPWRLGLRETRWANKTVGGLLGFCCNRTNFINMVNKHVVIKSSL